MLETPNSLSINDRIYSPLILLNTPKIKLNPHTNLNHFTVWEEIRKALQFHPTAEAENRTSLKALKKFLTSKSIKDFSIPETETFIRELISHHYLSAVFESDSNNKKEKRHLLPRSYIKNFAHVAGAKSLFLTCVNPISGELLAIEHSEVCGSQIHFYNDVLEDFLAKLENDYSKTYTEQIVQESPELNAYQTMMLALFLASLTVRYPSKNLPITLERLENKDTYSSYILNTLSHTATNLAVANWTWIKIDDGTDLVTDLLPFTLWHPYVSSEVLNSYTPPDVIYKNQKSFCLTYFPLARKIGLLLTHKDQNIIQKSNANPQVAIWKKVFMGNHPVLKSSDFSNPETLSTSFNLAIMMKPGEELDKNVFLYHPEATPLVPIVKLFSFENKFRNKHKFSLVEHISNPKTNLSFPYKGGWFPILDKELLNNSSYEVYWSKLLSNPIRNRH